MQQRENRSGIASRRVSPGKVTIAPLFGRPDSLHLAFVTGVLFGLREQLAASLPGCLVRLFPYQGGADVPGSRSALCREVAAMNDQAPSDRILLLDDDIIPTTTQILALLDMQEDEGPDEHSGCFPAVGLDYLPRGWTSHRASTILPGQPCQLSGYRVLMGAGCLMVTVGGLRHALQETKGYPSVSGVTDQGVWFADDYSLCDSLGGVVPLLGVTPHHLAAHVPEFSSEGPDRLLRSVGLGFPRVPRQTEEKAPETQVSGAAL